MAGTANAYRSARSALLVVAFLLVGGIAGSFVMGSRSLVSAETSATNQAKIVAQKVLPAVITPDDLVAPVSASRAKAIGDQLESQGLATTSINAVTVWKDDGTILFSTDHTKIGTRLPEQATPLHDAEKGTGVSHVVGGSFSTLAPIQVKGALAVAQFDQPYAPIFAGSAKPWRLIAIVVAILFFADLFGVWRVSRAAASAAANAAFRPTVGLGQIGSGPASQAAPSPKPAKGKEDAPVYLLPGFREEADARKKAEARAKAAEDHVATLQEQYRRSLEDLQVAQKQAKEVSSPAGKVDPRLEERALKAEGQIRLLEGQLKTTGAERDKLSKELAEAQAQAPAPDPEVEQRARRLEQESIALRAEVEGTKTELEVAKREIAAQERRATELEKAIESAQAAGDTIDTAKREVDGLRLEREAAVAEVEQLRAELESTRAEAARAARLQVELDDARGAAEEAKGLSEATTGELQSVRDQLEDAQTELRVLRDGEERATVLDEQLTSLRDELESTKKKHREHLETAAAKHREEIEAVRVELESFDHGHEAELEAAEARHQAELNAKEAEIDARAEQNRSELQSELEAIESDLKQQFDERLAQMSAEVETAKLELASGQSEMDTREQELLRTNTELQAAQEVSASMQQQLASLNTQLEESRASLASTEGEATAARSQLADAISEIEAVRLQHTSSSQELETTAAELASLREQLAAASNDLSAAENDAHARETKLAEVLAETEVTARDLAAAAEEVELLRRELRSAQAEVSALSETHTGAEGDLDASRAELAASKVELEATRTELTQAQAEVQAELGRGVELAERAERAERELAAISERGLEGGDETTARTELEEVLRVTQERLAGNTDKLQQLEENTRAAERELSEAQSRIAELEGELRRGQMEKAIRQLRGEDVDDEMRGDPISDDDVTAAVTAAAVIEDRRAATPFMKELSLDAKKTLTQILGVTLTLKHKKSPKEQAPLLRQLASFARRLDHTVSDLADADKLASGAIELNIRRTNMEALVERVVEESGVSADHDVRLETDELVIAVDPLRTEQILNVLLRGSAERTPPGAQIIVRLSRADGGAMIAVEDKEPSSDASISPIASRVARMLGGWIKVESRANGGSAFRVFLPDRSPGVEASLDQNAQHEPGNGEIEVPEATRDRLEIVVDEIPATAPDPDTGESWAAGQLLVQELQRLSQDD